MTYQNINPRSKIIALTLLFLSSLLINNFEDDTALARAKRKKSTKSGINESELIKPVNGYVSAIKKNDKEAWLKYFSQNAVIEDPVGSDPYKKKDEDNSELEIFYDTNIAENNISFDNKKDIVCGMDVFRDAVITIIPENGLEIKVKTYSLFQMTKDNGEVKINRLAAFWEMREMTEQLTGNGFKGFSSAMSFFWDMLSNQGVGNTFSLIKGNPGIGERGYKIVEKLAGAVNDQEGDDFIKLFENENSVIEFPANYLYLNPEGLLNKLGEQSEIQISEPRSAGWFTVCGFNLKMKKANKQGVAVFEFVPESDRIKTARFYWDR